MVLYFGFYTTVTFRLVFIALQRTSATVSYKDVEVSEFFDDLMSVLYMYMFASVTETG